MAYHQIDFLPIGEKQCGDSIVLRFGDLDSNDPSKQTVVVIDGGYKDDWQKVVKTVTEHYEAAKIDLVVSTHPDIDHINGLSGLLDAVPVDNLWLHLPWEHSSDFLAARQDEFSTVKLSDKLTKAMQSSNDLALAADRNNITPVEPFAGQEFVAPHGKLTVLSPTLPYYEELLGQILDKADAKASVNAGLVGAIENILKKGYEKVANWAEEKHDIETLTDNGETSPSNNTSVVILLELIDGKKFLFTGDAGMPALELAYQNYVNFGLDQGQLFGIQVPHHGSRKNVGPTILDKFLGEKTVGDDDKRGSAYVSAVENCEKHGHPKKVVTNAFRRRGYPVSHTKSEGFKIGHEREGWTKTVVPLPLYESVEADE